MLKLGFIGPARKIIKFEIEGKRVVYFDEIWRGGVQIYPLDQSLIDNMIANKSNNIKVMAALILDANKNQDLADYNSCNTEEEIAAFIIKDCKKQGLMEIK